MCKRYGVQNRSQPSNAFSYCFSCEEPTGDELEKQNSRNDMVSIEMKRASQVVRTCVRHGLGYFVHQFGLRWHLPFLERILVIHAKRPASVPAQVRLVLEELGGAFVKLGQVLSLRPDLVPPEFCEEFKKLLDNTSPLPYSTIKHVIEEELHLPIHDIFPTFSRHPLGSASVAQVHHATLKSGKEVVVKIMRPKVEEQFHADIDLMFYFARKIQQHIGNIFSPVVIVEEFEKYTRNELDFFVEARNLERFRHFFAKYQSVVIPQVFWKETTHCILVMEFLNGVKLSDTTNLPKTIDRRALARKILDISLAQIFELGMFHADLHPGNILLLPRGKIGLLDFGLVGELEEKYRILGVELFAALMQKNARNVAQVLLKTGTPSPRTSVQAFERDVELIITEWYAKTRQNEHVRVSNMMQHLFEVCIQNNIRMPADIIILGKALVTAEGTAYQLDTSLDFVDYAKARIALLAKKKRTVQAIASTALKKGYAFSEAVWNLPQQTLSLMEHLSQDTIRIGIADTDVKHLGLDISLSSNRISYSLLISALIISGSLLVDIGPKLFLGYSFASIASFLSAGLLLVPFLVSVYWEGRSPRDRHTE